MKIKYTFLYTNGLKDEMTCQVKSEEDAKGIHEVNDAIETALREGVDGCVTIPNTSEKGSLIVALKHVVSAHIEILTDGK